MKIAVVGLGLIGGSFCKAIKKYTDHRVFGIDNNSDAIQMALDCGAIEREILPEELCEMDFTIVSLHPEQTIAFILQHLSDFKKGSLVMDTCGVKTTIVNAVAGPLSEQGVIFVGAHPMAGREFSGFAYSLDCLYEDASFIITPDETTPAHTVEFITYFAKKLQFGKVVISTPQEHDRVIAFTSQLAHIVSNAYIKSPSLQQQSGFSAGSFLDLTRVAKLNEDMWTSLFLMNQQPLLFEIDTIIKKLQEYRQAIAQDDAQTLHDLLKEGRILKENSLALQ